MTTPMSILLQYYHADLYQNGVETRWQKKDPAEIERVKKLLKK